MNEHEENLVALGQLQFWKRTCIIFVYTIRCTARYTDSLASRLPKEDNGSITLGIRL
jgi:hypothetical protein